MGKRGPVGETPGKPPLRPPTRQKRGAAMGLGQRKGGHKEAGGKNMLAKPQECGATTRSARTPERPTAADDGSAETPPRHTAGTDSARPEHGALARREYGLLAPAGTVVDPANTRDPGSEAGHGATGIKDGREPKEERG